MANSIKALTEKIRSADEITPGIVDAINELAHLQTESDLIAASDLAASAIAHATAIKYPAGEAAALMTAGLCATRQRDYREALSFYHRALGIMQALDDQRGIATVHSKIGNTNLRTGDYALALDHYNQAIEILKGFDDQLAVANLYANAGIIHGFQGNYPLALKSHLQALKTYEPLNELSRIASSSFNIGLIYKEQQNYDEALKMYRRTLDIRQDMNDIMAVTDTLNNIGNVYQEQFKYDEALETHKKALKLRENLGDSAQIAVSFSNIGNVYKAISHNTLALDYYTRALFLFEKANDKRGLVQSYTNLGELYFELKEHKEAHHYLELARSLAEETGLKYQLRKAYEYLSMLYAQEGAYERAYQYHLLFTRLDKEISNSEISGQMAQMSLRYEIEQKERAAELEKTKNAELQKAYNLLGQEKQRSEELLLNILPEEVSHELKQFGKTKARSFEMVTVLFTDIKGFTKISEMLSAEEIVSSIDEYFETFDLIAEKHGIEKIKTIGDAYLCASGMPVPIPDHAVKMIAVAKDFIRAVAELKAKRLAIGQPVFDFRVGIHSGPLVAGVVGIKKFAYDIWGDTVNTSSRMQSNGEPGRINISQSTYELVKDQYPCIYRGEIEAKNKGKLKMYFVE